MSQSLKTLHEFGSVFSKNNPVQTVSGTALGDLANLGANVILVNTTGAATASLSSTPVGTTKTVVLDATGGNLVITPNTLLGGVTVTMSAAGNSTTFVQTRAGWAVVSNNGGVIA